VSPRAAPTLPVFSPSRDGCADHERRPSAAPDFPARSIAPSSLFATAVASRASERSTRDSIRPSSSEPPQRAQPRAKAEAPRARGRSHCPPPGGHTRSGGTPRQRSPKTRHRNPAQAPPAGCRSPRSREPAEACRSARPAFSPIDACGRPVAPAKRLPAELCKGARSRGLTRPSVPRASARGKVNQAPATVILATRKVGVTTEVRMSRSSPTRSMLFSSSSRLSEMVTSLTG
jgi:hypothetical protein